eukprot:COSAG01_NODE_55941_length_321_cov_3.261261_1_plen_38_part_01
MEAVGSLHLQFTDTAGIESDRGLDGVCSGPRMWQQLQR